MPWIIIYADGKSSKDWKILALNDAREHTEFRGYGDDIPGLFYDKNDIEYEDDWNHNTNTNEDVDEEYFEEFSSYQQEFWGQGDIENVVWDKVIPWIFSDDGKEFIEKHW